MTVDPFKNHFKPTRLIRISNDNLMKKDAVSMDEFKSLIFVEGKVIDVKDHEVFTELLVKDDSNGIVIPIVSFDHPQYNRLTGIMCVGTIHYNWIPDMRCKNLCYPVAVKANLIKPK